jgi:opacity protein-like surface antigen
MRLLTVAAACVAVFASGAVVSAADLSLKDPPPVYTPAPTPGWSGLYFGGHVGALWTGDRTTSVLEQVCRTPPPPEDDDEEYEYPGGGGGGGGGHDCYRDHRGENHNDHKHGRYDGKKHPFAPKNMSVVPKKAAKNKAPAAPICTDFTKTKDVTIEDNRDDVAVVGGLHVGYNWQRQSALLGVEADADFADGFDYIASLRGRLGYVAGDFLLYATAGIALAALDDNTVTFKTPLASHSFERGDDTLVGAVVGAGVEYKVASNLSVGLEGLYYFFGEESNSYNITEGGTSYRISEEVDNDVWTVRARVSYHFADYRDESLK